MKNLITILSGVMLISLLIGISITNFAELALLITIVLMAFIALIMAIESNRTVKEQKQFIENLLKK